MEAIRQIARNLNDYPLHEMEVYLFVRFFFGFVRFVFMVNIGIDFSHHRGHATIRRTVRINKPDRMSIEAHLFLKHCAMYGNCGERREIYHQYVCAWLSSVHMAKTLPQTQFYKCFVSMGIFH